MEFKTKMIGDDGLRDIRITDLIRIARGLHKRGLSLPWTQPDENNSYGSLSFRCYPYVQGANSFVINASSINLIDYCEFNQFVKVEKVDFQNGIIYAIGTRKPSFESEIHAAIYQRRPRVNAVIHGNCSPVPGYAKKFKIPVTRKEAPVGTLELVERILEVLDEYSVLEERLVLEVRNHGFITMGRTIGNAESYTWDLLKQIKRSKTC